MSTGINTSAIYEEIIEVFSSLKRSFALHHPAGEGDHLTHLRSAALGILSRMGPLPASELARLERISRPQATALIDGLAKAGLVERQESEKDRRVVRISITAEGRAALDRTMKAVRRGLAERLARLSPEELVELRGSLTSLAGLLDKLCQ